MAGVQKTYALILGIVAAVIGLWGFFQTPILGLFGVNALQSIVHLITGAFGIYVGTKGEGPGFNASLGWGALALGVLWYIPVASGLLASWFNINAATTYLHLVVGVLSLVVYYGVSE